jgi:hypothetical protein
MKVLCLFEGIGSAKKVFESLGFEVICVEINKKYNPTILSDIMKWNYKDDYKPGDFDIITASPVCLYWSVLRNTWIGRKCKSIHPTEVITKQHLLDDIEKYGKPMVDRTLEILDYFKPTYWWIENPNSSSMWKYIEEKYNHLNFETYIFDYCKYSDYGYKKPTRFITNYKGVEAVRCKNDCENLITIKTKTTESCLHKINLAGCNEIIDGEKRVFNTKKKRDELREMKLHAKNLGSWGKKDTPQIGVGGGSNREERYRIPPLLIEELIKPMFDWN